LTVRLVAKLSSSIGLALCLATAGTGVYWGVFNHGSEEWRQIHLKFAISCVFVSMVAHTLALIMLRKPKS
jgi:hypothetical protein